MGSHGKDSKIQQDSPEKGRPVPPKDTGKGGGGKREK